jgi:hypothetical protein
VITQFRTDLDHAPTLKPGWSWAQAKDLSEDDEILLETPGLMQHMAQHMDTSEDEGIVTDMIRYVEGAETVGSQVILLMTGLYDGQITKTVTVASAEVLDPEEYVLLLDN